jgi:RimJ/RimL family protein N-acetyltransferase
MQEYLPLCGSWGIIDKNHITNIKHEAPLVGILIYEPASNRTGYMHVATARKAWRTGMIDEAVEIVVEQIFEGIPSLTRLGAYMFEKNSPAISLAKRHNFKYEGTFHDVVVQNGEPANLVYFGLTRSNWQCLKHLSAPHLDSQVPSLEESEVLVESNNSNPVTAQAM